MLAKLILVLPLVACAETVETIDITAGSGGKADALAGKQISWRVGAAIDWFRYRTPESATPLWHTVSVRLRADDKLALGGTLVYFDELGEGDARNYDRFDLVDVGIVAERSDTQMAFAILDYNKYWETDQLTLFKCGDTNLFQAVAFDFERREITIDGTTTHAFAACGIAPAAGPNGPYWAFGTLATPVSNSTGKPFSGEYLYRLTAAVR